MKHELREPWREKQARINKAQREFRRENPDKVKNYQLKKNHGSLSKSTTVCL